jgi:hypothetical protein
MTVAARNCNSPKLVLVVPGQAAIDDYCHASDAICANKANNADLLATSLSLTKLRRRNVLQ